MQIKGEVNRGKGAPPGGEVPTAELLAASAVRGRGAARWPQPPTQITVINLR